MVSGRFTSRLWHRNRFGCRRNKQTAKTPFRSGEVDSDVVTNLTMTLRKFVGEGIGNLVS